MLVVAALGQSAMAARDLPALEVRLARIARSLAQIALSHRLVVTHEAGAGLLPAGPLLPADLGVAANAGVIGHVLGRELRNALPNRAVISLLAQAVVNDCENGPLRHRQDLRSGTKEATPSRIVEMPTLARFVEADDLVLCVGCVPVAQANSLLRSSDVRLDHDQVAATLAIELGADILLLLTDVPGIYARWPEQAGLIAQIDARAPMPSAIERTGVGDKLRAACRFANTPGTFAVIGAADDAESLVAGRAGTCVARSDPMD